MAATVSWTKKLEVIRHYNAIADIYDRRYLAEQNVKIRTALVHTDLRGRSFILDVGCGTGILFDHLKDSGIVQVGIDIAKKILKKVTERESYSVKVNIVLADADYMPFPNGIFDMVFAITLLQNLPKPEKTLKEIIRVSKPDATIIVTGLKKKFSLESFIKILGDSGLNIRLLKDSGELKDFIAICTVGHGTG